MLYQLMDMPEILLLKYDQIKLYLHGQCHWHLNYALNCYETYGRKQLKPAAL